MKKLFKMVLVFICLFTFVSCGKENPESIVINTFKEVKKEAIEKANKEAKKEVIEKAKPEEKLAESFVNLIDKSSITVNSVEEKEEITIVNTKIKSVDMTNYFREMMAHLLPLAFTANEKELQDEMVKFFEELNKRTDLKYIENDLVVELKKVDGKLMVTDESKEKMKALMTGFDELINRFKN